MSNVSAWNVTADGRKVFFPWGRFGRGYEIENEEHHRALRRIMVSQIALVPTSVLTVVLLGRYALFVAPVIVGIGLFTSHRLTRGLPKSDEKLAWRDHWRHQERAQARFLEPFGIWLMLIAALFFGILGIAMLFGSDNVLGGAVLTAISGFGAISTVRMLRVHARLNREAEPHQPRNTD
jgi:hypothetical protein